MTTEKEIELLERQRFDAQISKDFGTLEKLFADDLIYTHSNGQEHSKSEYIESIRNGSSQYLHIEIEALTVRLYNDGNTAVVNGTALIKLSLNSDGSANFTHLKYVTVHINHPGHGWQVVLWQSQKQAA